MDFSDGAAEQLRGNGSSTVRFANEGADGLIRVAAKSTDEVRARFAGVVADLMSDRGGLGDITFLCPPKPVDDDTAKLLITNRAGQPSAVVYWSPAAMPRRVARDTERAEQARAALGPELGIVIPAPLVAGEIEGRSFVVVPYFRPLRKRRWSGAIQRASLRSWALDWLCAATQRTVASTTPERTQRDFEAPLAALAANAKIDRSIRDRASHAIRKLREGAWRPRYVLAHNDLWKGNFLSREGTISWLPKLGAANRIPFVIIDWSGSRVHGHAIYDLVRLSMSLGVSLRRFRFELRRHCLILGCDIGDAASYLLASLGHLGAHLECFPEDRYLRLVDRCWETMGRIQKSFRL